MKKLIYIFQIVIVCSCSSYPEAIEDVFRQAGNNRNELEKVLKNYNKKQEDSLKLRAAEFLIINMPGKYSKYYDAPWNYVATVQLRWSSSSNKQKVLDTYGLGNPVVREDVKYITANYLINNIELAFKAWEDAPWGKHIPFETFCEDILPYRISTEPLEDWRKLVLASFADPYQQLLKDTLATSLTACKKINSLLPRFRIDKDFPAMSYSQLMATTRGPCDNACALAIFSMRALGIPVTFDQTIRWPQKPHSRSGHSWNAVRDNNGNYISFMGADTNPNEPHQGTTFLKSKAYRRMFANSFRIKAEMHNIPSVFRGNLKDISAEHSGMINIDIPAKYLPDKQTDRVYLATRHEKEWYPVAYGTTDGKSLYYDHIGYDIMYWPVYYENNNLNPANDPFLVDKDGNITWYSYNSKDTLLTIVEDLHKQRGILNFLTVEVATNEEFSDATILYTVRNLLVYHGHKIIIPVYDNFRFIRFKSSQTGYCDKVVFTIYGKDNKPRSSTFSEQSESWHGIGSYRKEEIGSIHFVSLSDKNSDFKGFNYKLVSLTKDGWKSCANQIVMDTMKIEVPSKALYYLRNTTLNLNGEVFIIKDGKPYYL
jgi:hypothetical protein